MNKALTDSKLFIKFELLTTLNGVPGIQLQAGTFPS